MIFLLWSINLIFFIFFPFLWVFLYVKKRDNILRYFSLAKVKKCDFWFHAASMGEAGGLFPILDKLIKDTPNAKVAFSVMTKTAYQHVQKRYGDRVDLFFFPFDLIFIQKKLIEQISPQKIIITETELWPSMIYIAKKKNIPLLLVNARLSEGKFKFYFQTKFFWKNLLNSFTEILAQSSYDYRRFASLGVRENILKEMGNTKYMIKKTEIDVELQNIKEILFKNKKSLIFTLGSIHPEELRYFTSIFENADKNDIYFAVAPRHLHKLELYVDYFQSLGLICDFRSKNGFWEKSRILLLDTMGELVKFYQIADMVFIGGSLNGIGGHNPYEAIMCEKMTFIGEDYQNAAMLVEELQGNGIITVLQKDAVNEIINEYIDSYEEKNELIKNKIPIYIDRQRENFDNIYKEITKGVSY